MVWVEITKIKTSDYNKNTQLIYFNDHNNKEKFVILSSYAKKYVNLVRDLQVGDQIFIIKTFNENNKELYIIKDVEKR